MKIEEAEKIIDDMYQEKMNTRIGKIEKGTVIHAEKEVAFTKLEEASLILLREELSLKRKIEEQEKIIKLMAKDIAENKLDEDICRQVKDPKKEECYAYVYDEKACIDCVIEYYEKKARGK